MSDETKTQYHGIPVDVLEEVAKVITGGDKKHGVGSWRYKEPDVFFDALMRHLVEFRKGVKEDKDDGLHPLAHVIVNAIYLWKTEGFTTWRAE